VFPDCLGQPETEREKLSSLLLLSLNTSHATSPDDPLTLPITVQYGSCVCRMTQTSFTGKGKDTTSPVGVRSAESYWKWVSIQYECISLWWNEQ